jgi:ribosomal protein S12 methylthiotransferase accessory factor
MPGDRRAAACPSGQAHVLHDGGTGWDATARAASFLPPLAPFGITRTGDLTDLDVIGIPVWFAVRPNSRSLSVSQGKGLTHEQARISAVMESVEGAVAEQTRPLVAEFGTPTEMTARGHKLVPVLEMARCKSASFDPGRQRAWVRGVEYGTGQPIFAPYELVGLDMRVDFPWDYDTFRVSSNGLAAGPDFEFAAVRALFEVIERDAMAPVEMFGHHSAFAWHLSWQPAIHAGLDEAVGKVRAAGLEPRFYGIASKIGLPVVAAVITRPVLNARGAGEQLSGGFACRPKAADAALSALLEAVQSRLTNIAGARDDMDASQYEAGGGSLPPLKADALPLSAFAALHPFSSSPKDTGTLAGIAAALKTAGYPEIFLFDLPGLVEGVSVVRALVPGLKSFVEGEAARFGVDDLIALTGDWCGVLPTGDLT